MTSSPILAPIIAMVLWTFVMEVWLYATRIPAMTRLKIAYDPKQPPSAFEQAMPAWARWPADNYNHLHEQPTVFYATALVLAFVGAGGGLALWLAWTYVAIRILHSLVQATRNVVMLRFGLFVLSSLVLLGLTVRAALAVF